MKPRHFTALVLVSAAFAVAALIAVSNRETANRAAFAPQLLFPGLEQQIEAIAKITVDTVQGKIIVARDQIAEGKGGWNLPERGGWPANFDTVRQSVLALAKLTAIERRTALAENHAALLLKDPGSTDTDGRGFRILAENASGEVLAALIVGKVQAPASANRPGTAYVRRGGEDQSYLAQGDVNFPLLLADWIDRVLFDLAADRIQSVTVTPPSGPSYTIQRTDAKAPFTVDRVPQGKALVLAELPENIAKSVALLPLDDAMPADKIDFANAFQAEHKTYDGLVLRSWTVLVGNSRWTRFEAAFDVALAEKAAALAAANPALLKPEAAQKQIAEINARTKGWAFKLPGMKATDLTRDYDSLFKTPDPAEKAQEDSGGPSGTETEMTP